MRLLSYLTTFLIAVLLAACGGGGGSPGLSSGSVSAFSVAAPSTLQLDVGLSQQYGVKGGVKPYTVFSNKPQVASVWPVGEDTVAIGAVIDGAATVTVLDAKGSKYDIAVTVAPVTTFYTTAPSSLTISPGAASAQTFVLGGGRAPYTAVSSSPRIASVVVDGNNMTITGNPTGEQDAAAAGSATISIRDATGATTLTTAVTVATAKLTLSISTAQAYRGDVITATITGGTPPYRTQAGIDGITTPIIVNGNRLQVTLERLAAPVIVSVFDANNQRADVSLTIIDGAPSIRLSPSAITVSENDTAAITLSTYGVTATGTPLVFSSNPKLLQGAYANKVVTVSTGTNGTRCVAADTTVTITIIDSAGLTGTSSITIKDNNGAAGC